MIERKKPDRSDFPLPLRNAITIGAVFIAISLLLAYPEWLKRIPPEVYGAFVGAGIAAFVTRMQLRHDTRERERDRQFNF